MATDCLGIVESPGPYLYQGKKKKKAFAYLLANFQKNGNSNELSRMSFHSNDMKSTFVPYF